MKSEDKAQRYMTATPAADVIEGHQGWTIYLDMPGVSDEMLEVNLEDRLLKVSAASGLTRNGHAIKYERAFQISDEIDHNHIKASLKDGVMELILPKAEAAKARKIQVISA